MIKDKEVAPEPQEHKCVAVDKPPYQCLTCGEMPKGIRTESVQVVENSKEQPSDTQNDTSELDAKTAQMDGDANSLNDLLKDVSTTDISIERKIHIVVCAMLGLDDEDHADDDEARPFEELLLSLIAQSEQAAELRGRIDENKRYAELTVVRGKNGKRNFSTNAWIDPIKPFERLKELQATKPEKEG